MVVLAALREPAFELVMGGQVDAAVFSNVGDDSEHPASLAYVADIATPWAAGHGLDVVTTGRTLRDGTPETLMEQLVKPSKSIPIPVRMANGAPGNRSCTADHKIRVIAKWLKANGATADDPATVAIGISTDEVHRISRRTSDRKHERVVYPLIDLNMSRQDCMNAIAEHLPVPGKSSCFFCPFHTVAAWGDMRRDEPDLFEKSATLETQLNARRAELWKDPVYLTRYGKPLHEAIHESQTQLPGLESIGETGCDSGHCFT
jgi:hypothetical protein